MKRASITEAKNNLSRLLDTVREGGTVWITDRSVPVARLSPVDPNGSAASGHLGDLIRAGFARPAAKPLDVKRLTTRTLPTLRRGVSAVAALDADRNASP